MAYQIEFNEEARKDFKQLDNSVKISIKKYLNKLINVEDPKAFGEKLTGNLVGCWKYRVGNYRIITEIQDEQLVVIIIAVGHRSVIYKIVDKRFNNI